MSSRSAIVIVVDRLGAGFLGPYGNSWLETPAFNQLASDSFLFEQAIIDTPRVETLYRSYWQGIHAAYPDTFVPNELPLAEKLRQSQIRTELLTDEPKIAHHPLAKCFSQQRFFPASEETNSAHDIGETQFAQFFTQAAESIEQANEPYLLWIHNQGMNAPWEAPLDFRERFVDEDDPDPPCLVTVPSLMLPDKFDPDELLGIVHAYAGQVVLLDACLEMLLESINNSPLADETMLIFTSSRGFPLGEHRIVGSVQECLYGETLHVPWIVRMPKKQHSMQRGQQLVQPADLYATLVDWFCDSDCNSATAESLLPMMKNHQHDLRQIACSFIDPYESSIRTPSWFLRKRTESTSQTKESFKQSNHIELYSKPGDRWEANEVSNLCREIAEELEEILTQFLQATDNNQSHYSPQLSHALLHGLE